MRARRSALARELIDLSVGPNFMKEFERVMVAQMGELDKKGGEEAIWVRTNMPSMASRMIERFYAGRLTTGDKLRTVTGKPFMPSTARR